MDSNVSRFIVNGRSSRSSRMTSAGRKRTLPSSQKSTASVWRGKSGMLLSFSSASASASRKKNGRAWSGGSSRTEAREREGTQGPYRTVPPDCSAIPEKRHSLMDGGAACHPGEPLSARIRVNAVPRAGDPTGTPRYFTPLIMISSAMGKADPTLPARRPSR